MTANQDEPLQLTRKDFQSDQDVRWCPGCGDYAILATLQRTLAKMGLRKEDQVFISGIGCSSRFPYYMNCYGFHTVHGRALAVATGLKSVRPELTVWVITGDGDALSIGGNHLIHCLRRNVDLNILLFNNRIYGLTKGQYSPTSETGKITKSSPVGSIEHPLEPLALALASGATFVARTVDTDAKHLGEVIDQAAAHMGCSFVEIYQNCIVFNDKAFAPVIAKENRDEHMLYLEHGQPLVFGADGAKKGVRLNGLHLEAVDLTGDPAEQGIIVHDSSIVNPAYHYLLSQMHYPEMPVPFGVLRCVEQPTYEGHLQDQIDAAVAKSGPGNLEKLLYRDTWQVGSGVATAMAGAPAD